MFYMKSENPKVVNLKHAFRKVYFIKHKTLISEKWTPGNPINV